MKKILSLASLISLLAVCGCTTTDIDYEHEQTTTANISFKAFNDEAYVWESFHFTTNRVNGVK